MKKYEISYRNAKASYTATKLEAAAYQMGCYQLEHDSDYLAAAVKFFCEHHFMWAGAARCNCVDAETRGDKTQSWQYQPNGSFSGWITAVTVED